MPDGDLIQKSLVQHGFLSKLKRSKFVVWVTVATICLWYMDLYSQSLPNASVWIFLGLCIVSAGYCLGQGYADGKANESGRNITDVPNGV